MSDFPLVLLLLLATAVLLRIDPIFYVVYVLVGAYGLAKWWTQGSLPRLRLSRRFDDHIFAGNVARVDITIENGSRLPVPWLRYEEAPAANLALGLPLREVVTLGSRQQLRLSYELIGRRRGCHRVGPGLLSSGDPFGFAEATMRFEEARPLVVYPRIIPLAGVGLASRAPQGAIRSHRRVFADPSRVAGLRAYRSGDPLRSIDWKSSARAGALRVKKHEPSVNLTTVIFLDMAAGAYAPRRRAVASEWAVVVAASLAACLIGFRQAVGLASNGLDSQTGVSGWRLPPRPGRGHLMAVLERLARVEIAETSSLAEALPALAAGLTWGVTVVAVTASGDEAVCRALSHLRRAGLNPVLVAVEPHARFDMVRERAGRLGVAAHHVADERQLRLWGAGMM